MQVLSTSNERTQWAVHKAKAHVRIDRQRIAFQTGNALDFPCGDNSYEYTL